MEKFKRYIPALATVLLVAVLYIYKQPLGEKAAIVTLTNFREMLAFLPPIFILVGLLDVWVPKETMIKYMGQDSGWKGILIALVLGSAAAGPLYAAFPIAALLIKKGARFAYILFFLGAWSSTKLPLVLYETASLGFKFTAIHISVSIVGFLVASLLIEKLVSDRSKEEIYNKAESI